MQPCTSTRPSSTPLIGAVRSYAATPDMEELTIQPRLPDAVGPSLDMGVLDFIPGGEVKQRPDVKDTAAPHFV